MNKKEYNGNETEKTVKHKVYDSVFIDLFSYKENLKDLYKALLKDKAKSDVTEDDIDIINIEKVFINDLYNDLSFSVNNDLVILLEAQSTYSKNIATRLLLYSVRSLEEWIRNENKHKKLYSLYNKKEVKIPKIKLYTIYTGPKKMETHYINLKEREYEVIEMLAPLVTTEEYMEDMADEKYEKGKEEGKKEGRKEGIQLGKKEGIKLGEQRGEKIGIIKGLFMINATDDKIIELTKITPEELEKYKKDFDI